MKITSTKKYEFGFVLSEIELRRVIDISKEQISKSTSTDEIVEEIDVSFKNGVIAQNLTIEQVLALENAGANRIVTIDISVYKKNTPESILEEDRANSIRILFNDCSNNTLVEYYSVFFRVIGDNRDWTHITFSLIDDRVLKIKRNTYWLNIINSNTNFIILLFLVGILSGIVAFNKKISENEIDEKVHKSIYVTADSLFMSLYINKMKESKYYKNSDSIIPFYIESEENRLLSSFYTEKIKDSLITSYKEKRTNSSVRL